MTWLVKAYLVLFVFCAAVRLALEEINNAHLRRRGGEVPAEFAGLVDGGTLQRMRDYTVTRSRFGSLESLAGDILVLVILFSGFIPWVDSLVAGHSFVWAGILFFLGTAVPGWLLGIPFDLYGTFGIERRFGFSTATIRLWLSDLVKSSVLSLVLLMVVLGVMLALIQAAPGSWWLWVWLFYAGFQLLLTWLYPVLIAPMFNKFEPLDDEDLVAGITELTSRVGFRLKGVYRMDASRRSRHSNAYFTGVGSARRIVLFDSLLENHEQEEILAVLAHELGHWKKRHVRRQLAMALGGSLVVLWLAWRLSGWGLLYESFGLDAGHIYVGLLVLGLLVRPLFFFLAPVPGLISRRYERQADAFARELTGSGSALVAALKRLATDNLSNLYPHPVYSWFYYSHPPLIERIRELERP